MIKYDHLPSRYSTRSSLYPRETDYLSLILELKFDHILSKSDTTESDSPASCVSLRLRTSRSHCPVLMSLTDRYRTCLGRSGFARLLKSPHIGCMYLDFGIRNSHREAHLLLIGKLSLTAVNKSNVMSTFECRVLMPFFDPDTNMLFLAGKVDIIQY